MDNPILQQASAWINKSENILLLTHEKADGDALSSLTALTLLLKKLHKNVTAVCAPLIPEVYRFLPGLENISTSLSVGKDFVISISSKTAEIDNLRYTLEDDKINIFISPKKGEITAKDVSFIKGQPKYDLIIVLGCPDYAALGKIYDEQVDLFFTIPVINIDHHVNNTHFGKINAVDVTASSTCEIIMSLLPLLSKQTVLDQDLATLLLCGMIVATGSFQNQNTTPRAFSLAANLIGMGARQQEIIKNIYKTKQLSTLKMWGKILSNVKNDPMYRLVWSTITQKDIAENKYAKNDIPQIIDDLLVNAPGAEIILLLSEEQRDETKVYIKTTNPSIDAMTIAALFQGTGNYSQATAHIAKPILQAEAEVFQKVSQYQARRLGIGPDTTPAALASSPLPPQVAIPHPGQSIPMITGSSLEKSIGDSLEEQLGHTNGNKQKGPATKKNKK